MDFFKNSVCRIPLEVVHKDNSVIGTALLVAAGCEIYRISNTLIIMHVNTIDPDNHFSTVILQSLQHNIPKDIDLYKAIDGKAYFHEFQVCVYTAKCINI